MRRTSSDVIVDNTKMCTIAVLSEQCVDIEIYRLYIVVERPTYVSGKKKKTSEGLLIFN